MAFPLDEKFVRAAEAALGARLPQDYVAELLKSNGGSVEADGDDWMLHPIADTSDRKRIARTANDVIRETNTWREWPNVPEGAICIADNGGGDKLVFLRRGDTFGSDVFRWYHESGNLEQVAAQFSDLERID